MEQVEWSDTPPVLMESTLDVEPLCGTFEPGSNKQTTDSTPETRERQQEVTLVDMIAAKLGYVWVIADEVIQEICELVARAQHHVAALQVLVHNAQVKVVAEGVDVHEVPHFVALFGEEHRKLEQTETPTVISSTRFHKNPSGKFSHFS